MGIGIDAPKYSRMNSEDFVLLDCKNWTKEDQAYYEEANSELKFFQTNELKERRMQVTEFPLALRGSDVPKTGRNATLPVWIRQKVQALSWNVARLALPDALIANPVARHLHHGLSLDDHSSLPGFRGWLMFEANQKPQPGTIRDTVSPTPFPDYHHHPWPWL